MCAERKGGARGEGGARGGGVRFFRKQPRKRQKHELQKKLGMLCINVKVLFKNIFGWTIIGGARIVLRILRLRRTNKFW